MSLSPASDPELEKLLAELEEQVPASRAGLIRRLREHLLDRPAPSKTQRPAAINGDRPPAAARSPDSDRELAAACPAQGQQPDFKRLFEGLPGLFLVLDPELHVVAASDAYLQATLTQREAIVGRHLFDIFPDNPNDPSADSIRNTRASMQRVLQTKTTDVMVIQRHDVRRPESEGGGWAVRYWSPVNSPLLNPDGSIAYIVHRVENVTDYVLLKHQGAEQEKLTDELRERAVRMEADLYARSRQVAEASEQLKSANEALARMNEQMRELSAFKDQFFATISHELRTPLMLILGPLRRVLTSAGLDETHHRNLAVAERNARTLLKIVNDLLDLTRLDAGRMSVAYARTDVAWLARYVASHFDSLAGYKPIRFSTNIPPQLTAEIDAEKTERVLFNLLSNAFKFTPAGGAVQLTVRTEANQLHLIVDDTGPGVPRELREAVFERFRQVEGGTTRRHGGTGLGLAIAREFVRLHQGAIAIGDAPDGGARFTVGLPLDAPAGVQVAAAAPARLDEEVPRTLLADLAAVTPPPPPVGVPAATNAPLVLVVEDNAEMSAFVAEALAPGHRVATAADGREGLEKAIELRPDLIVTDVMMPRMSGDELVVAVRRQPELDRIPILVLTAKADEQMRVRLLSAGAQACLTKPFAIEELVVRASGLIAEKRRAEAALGAERELLTRIIDTIPVMITIYDPAQQSFRFNRELREVLGWTEADAAAGDFMAKVYPDPEERRQAAAFMQSLAPGWRDFRTMAKDGTEVLSTWANVRLTNNVVVGIGVDIRARRAAEEALRQREAELRALNETLEHRVATRTRQLEEANRELEAFSYSVSHDLRAPLRAIAGFSALLVEEFGNEMNPEAVRYAGIVQNGARKMGQLIDDLLAFSRLGRHQLALHPVDLGALCREVIAALKRDLGDRTVEWRIGDLPPARADLPLLRQVLINLLSNAVKYTRPRPVAIIEVGATAPDQQPVIYHVRDNGVGFEMKYASKLFGVFQRLHGADEFEGTGVGLAIVQRIIRRHGGRIWAEAEAGVGATFYFTLEGDTHDERSNH